MGERCGIFINISADDRERLDKIIQRLNAEQPLGRVTRGSIARCLVIRFLAAEEAKAEDK